MRALAPSLPLRRLPSPALLLAMLAAALAVAFLPLPMAVVLVLGPCAILLTLARVEYGLALLALSVPFGSLAEIELADFSLSATEFMVPLVFFAWVLQMVAAREARVRFSLVPVPFFIFLAVLALSLSQSTSLGLSLKEIVKWLEFLAVFILAANTVRERWQANLILGAILAAGVAEALHGWFQFLLKEGPEAFLVGGLFLRAYGVFGQPNPYGGYLATVLPLSLGLLLAYWGRPSQSDRLRAGLLAAFAILAAALLMSLSRGGMLGFFGTLLVMGLVRSRTLRKLLLLALLVALFLALFASYGLLPGAVQALVDGVLEGFAIFDVREVAVTPENWSIVERMALWTSGWRMWLDNPWLGVGIGNFKAVYPDYALPRWEFGQEHAHNYYLNLLAETGVLGLAAYLLLAAALFAYVIGALRAARAGGWGFEAYLSLGILGMLVALSLHNFFDNIYVHGMLVQLGLVLGLVPFARGRGGQRPW